MNDHVLEVCEDLKSYKLGISNFQKLKFPSSILELL